MNLWRSYAYLSYRKYFFTISRHPQPHSPKTRSPRSRQSDTTSIEWEVANKFRPNVNAVAADRSRYRVTGSYQSAGTAKHKYSQTTRKPKNAKPKRATGGHLETSTRSKSEKLRSVRAPGTTVQARTHRADTEQRAA
jgi:hypothetical protein